METLTSLLLLSYMVFEPLWFLWSISSGKISPFWKELQVITQLFKCKFNNQMGNGKDFSLLFDLWCVGHSLVGLLEKACFTFLKQLASPKLSSIICRDYWSLPTRIKTKKLDCAKFISSIILKGGLNKIIWNDGICFSSKSIKSFIFNLYLDLSWYKDIWFKGHALNYSFYY